jgi:hypothetical protein
MIDISSVMRDSEYFTKKMLEDYILMAAGGSSLTFLLSATGVEPEQLVMITPKLDDSKTFRFMSKRIYDRFHSEGGAREPALVYGFRVDARFQSGGYGNCHTDAGLVFDKANAVKTGDKLVTHSMLLVGARYDYLKGEYFFALQN